MIEVFKKLYVVFILELSFYLSISEAPGGNGLTYIEYNSHAYPTSFTLANKQLLLAYSEGLFLYDSEFYNETSILNITLGEGDIKNIQIKQFSESDGGYILIIAKNTLYVFDSNLNNYTEQNITNEGTIQNLIVIKKEGNFLYYTTNSFNSLKLYFYIYYYKYDLNTNSSVIINSKTYDSEGWLTLAKCVWMIPKSSNKNLITCFYLFSDAKLYTSSFDLENNLTKIDEYNKTKDGTIQFTLLYLETNEDKSKCLLIGVDYSSTTQWLTFDISNNIFSETNNLDYLCGSHSQERVRFYYFPSNQEYVYICLSYTACQFYASSFGVDFKSGISIKYLMNKCCNSIGISLFYSEKLGNYSVIAGVSK